MARQLNYKEYAESFKKEKRFQSSNKKSTKMLFDYFDVILKNKSADREACPH